MDQSATMCHFADRLCSVLCQSTGQLKIHLEVTLGHLSSLTGLFHDPSYRMLLLQAPGTLDLTKSLG
jgi:hypothetical protein